jgi:hypothetical protein
LAIKLLAQNMYLNNVATMAEIADALFSHASCNAYVYGNIEKMNGREQLQCYESV